MKILKYIKADSFVLLILFSVLLASFFPVRDASVENFLKVVSQVGIFLLFFMHGAKLSREAIISGITNWKMHLLVVLLTFALFPILGFFLGYFPENILKKEIYTGFLFLCALPSTVQSSIIFTSTARGNMAGALCSASISSILGVFISPLLVKLLVFSEKEFSTDFFQSLQNIFLQLMLPFLLGHLMRFLFIDFIQKNPKIIKIIDQFSILLVVYLTFGKSVNEGIWQRLHWGDILIVCIFALLLLLFVLYFSKFVAKILKFPIEDEIVIVFCGSKKSLVNGVPMAQILFPNGALGVFLLPLLIFHQIQLIVCAILAKKYQNRK